MKRSFAAIHVVGEQRLTVKKMETSMANGAVRLNINDVLDGAYIGAIIRSFCSLGVLESLEQPRPLGYLAERHQLDSEVLRPLLEFVSQRSQLIERIGEMYVRCAQGGAKEDEDCILRLYLEAYWPNLEQVSSILKKEIAGAAVVDRISYARAFGGLSHAGFPEIVEVLAQIGATDVLDVGCGPGALLLGVAERNAHFRGWGLDSNPEMCTIARRRIKKADLERRVQIFQGDSLDVIPDQVRENVSTLTVCSVLNEFCSGKNRKMVEWLNRARHVFSRRVLIVADYYGELGGNPSGGEYQNAKLHDVTQVVSGQGVPPSDLSGWKCVYDAAGCTLMHVADIECRRFRRFIHFVWLGSANG